MDLSLHHHIVSLEDNIQTLKDSLTAVKHDEAEYEQIVESILTAEKALQHFRLAYAQEQRLKQQATGAERTKVGSSAT